MNCVYVDRISKTKKSLRFLVCASPGRFIASARVAAVARLLERTFRLLDESSKLAARDFVKKITKLPRCSVDHPDRVR